MNKNTDTILLLGVIGLLLYFRKKTVSLNIPLPTDGTFINDTTTVTTGNSSNVGIDGIKYLPDYAGFRPFKYLG